MMVSMSHGWCMWGGYKGRVERVLRERVKEKQGSTVRSNNLLVSRVGKRVNALALKGDHSASGTISCSVDESR